MQIKSITADGITGYQYATHQCGHPAASYRSRAYVARHLAEMREYAERTDCGHCGFAAGMEDKLAAEMASAGLY